MTTQTTSRFKWQILGLVAALFVGMASSARAITPVAITFHGDSTLHGFGGAVEGRMEEEAGPAGAAVVCVTVPVRAMKTGHDGRDRKMYAMFQADSFARIKGTMDAAALREAGAVTTAVVHLEIHGLERDVPASVAVIPAADGSPGRRHVAFDVSLRQFGLAAPSVIGLIRVADTVHVTAEWVPGQDVAGVEP